MVVVQRNGMEILSLNCSVEANRLEDAIRRSVLGIMKKRGVVIGLSGGIDSSVCAAICVKALGSDRVFGLFMPEKDTNNETNRLGRIISEHLGIDTIMEDLTPTLETIGCYDRRDNAIRLTVPDYSKGWQCKVVLPSILDSNRLNVSMLVVKKPDGTIEKFRMSRSSYLGTIAATNFKQRTRKIIEYYHADKLNYAVVGTPNRLEYELGFFVKTGDGSADLKPIAHLYKSQVYQMAEHYGLPEEIIIRRPTTDTFPMEQTQEEFYFSLPLDLMDIALFCYNNNIPVEELSRISGLDIERSLWVLKDISQKKRSTRYLHMKPEVFGPVETDPRV